MGAYIKKKQVKSNLFCMFSPGETAQIYNLKITMCYSFQILLFGEPLRMAE